MFVDAHLYPAEVVGCRQQPLHFMAEPRPAVTHLHAALGRSPLQTKLRHRRSVARRSLEHEKFYLCTFSKTLSENDKRGYSCLCTSARRWRRSRSYLPANNNTAGGLARGGRDLALLGGPWACCKLAALRKGPELDAHKNKNKLKTFVFYILWESLKA